MSDKKETASLDRAKSKKDTASLESGLTFGATCGPYDERSDARTAKAAAPVSTDFFGDAIPPVQHGARLSLEFSYPPFSVLNARDGWWQERKREWLALGIQSELGRGEQANDTGLSSPARTNDAARMQAKGTRKTNAIPGGSPQPLDRMKNAKRAANAAPGGSPLPSANYSQNKARGDGRGRPIK